ncbi:hypothetical protein CapIbe_001405 [Capra ibex]
MTQAFYSGQERPEGFKAHLRTRPPPQLPNAAESPTVAKAAAAVWPTLGSGRRGGTEVKGSAVPRSSAFTPGREELGNLSPRGTKMEMLPNRTWVCSPAAQQSQSTDTSFILIYRCLPGLNIADEISDLFCSRG